ncbi:alkaline phosphatase family protein [Clostridium butyricum]|uniref:2,3-bisphosphoglycerate-independent phosphoglycerate mutase (Phosphoglyceromutase) (Bpg-independent pgam) (Apgam) n=1 Tax=Clostridium butyricum E4 str. BoNT E BL5262 TaxID=632245 RepID=C4IDM5_CLOBU|nr:alkaline phosphatase family protein [Clostridium butyricum]APF23242.1 phosphoglycerate mutase (2,3-diphosphoglycerate-independent), archaeal form family protein [Clostridium butyricum]EDT75225.1 2,3-bisphosphoglycerate-independent phosphoglycerate mutase [Clostridium butyricum 5521]EEP55301.1 2,3-bisphosphoglycerate-independent phosphoglycerate mutase (phosphoglyceromutase) (bpg-independent pgam) (apgam) [Clostridium butyricum E4 str. BoNT E BL5262]NFL31533.1 2,3-bisphosphoglycerate-independ
MKYLMIILDGIGDDPLEQLSMKTPLECAFAPNLNYIANKGMVGVIETVFDGFPVESMVCIMGLLGYDPNKYYPNGRASFEALAKGINIDENDIAFRCNIIKLDKCKKKIEDFTSNLISDTEAKKFLKNCRIPNRNWELFNGQGYRNLFVMRGAGISASNIVCYPPHMHINEEIKNLKPYDKNDSRLMHEVWNFLSESYDEKSNRMLWLWSPSSAINWPSFESITGLKGAVVCGLDFLKGIAMAADMYFEDIPGATGYIDTDYIKKVEYTKKYLIENDFVLLHINSTDELSHQHDYNGKLKEIEKIDELVIGPLLKELRERYKEKFRIVICGDHKTRCSDGKHVGDAVPYVMYGTNVEKSNIWGFCEKACGKSHKLNSLEFINKNFKL